ITTLPVGPEHPGCNAGPSFELFYENDYLMPHRDAAWALLEERVREAATFCGLIQEIAPEAVTSDLEPIGGALTGVADSLAERFGDWGASSRFAAGLPETGVDAPTASVLWMEADSLLAAVGARTVKGSAELTTLFERAHGA